MKLTDTNVKNAKTYDTPKKLSGGDGLFLFIRPSGGKLWRLAYCFNGKQEVLSFGAYPAVSLKEAWRRKDRARELLASGTDPGQHKKEQKVAAAQAEQEARDSFECSENGLSIHEVSRRFGIASSTLHCWLHDINTAAPAQLAKHGKVVSDAEAQLSKLLRQKAQLCMECEILKKATALFVRE